MNTEELQGVTTRDGFLLLSRSEVFFDQPFVRGRVLAFTGTVTPYKTRVRTWDDEAEVSVVVQKKFNALFGEAILAREGIAEFPPGYRVQYVRSIAATRPHKRRTLHYWRSKARPESYYALFLNLKVPLRYTNPNTGWTVTLEPGPLSLQVTRCRTGKNNWTLKGILASEFCKVLYVDNGKPKKCILCRDREWDCMEYYGRDEEEAENNALFQLDGVYPVSTDLRELSVIAINLLLNHASNHDSFDGVVHSEPQEVEQFYNEFGITFEYPGEVADEK